MPPPSAQKKRGGGAIRAAKYRVQDHAIPMNPVPPPAGACGPIAGSVVRARISQRDAPSRQARKGKENAVPCQKSAVKKLGNPIAKRRGVVPDSMPLNAAAKGEGACMLIYVCVGNEHFPRRLQGVDPRAGT